MSDAVAARGNFAELEDGAKTGLVAPMVNISGRASCGIDKGNLLRAKHPEA